MESFVDDGVPDTPGMNREPSYTVQAACDFQASDQLSASLLPYIITLIMNRLLGKWHDRLSICVTEMLMRL